jgi:hypothetical protein
MTTRAIMGRLARLEARASDANLALLKALTDAELDAVIRQIATAILADPSTSAEDRAKAELALADPACRGHPRAMRYGDSVANVEAGRAR